MPNNRKDSEYRVNEGAKTNFNKKPAAKAASKKRGVATTEAVKKMKRKKSSAPKPRAKPGSDSPKSGASRSTAGKVSTSAKSGASRSTKGKVSTSAKSGATRGTSGKIDNSLGARFKRGMKRVFGTESARKTTGPGPEKFDRTSAGGKKVNELSLKNKYKTRKQARTGRK